jgi:hypothetical protein
MSIFPDAVFVSIKMGARRVQRGSYEFWLIVDVLLDCFDKKV